MLFDFRDVVDSGLFLSYDRRPGHRMDPSPPQNPHDLLPSAAAYHNNYYYLLLLHPTPLITKH